MKKFIAMILLLVLMTGSFGCGRRVDGFDYGSLSVESENTTVETEEPVEATTEEITEPVIQVIEKYGNILLTEKVSSEGYSGYFFVAELEVKGSDEFGQGIHEKTAEEWQTYYSLSEEERRWSSHLWGECTQFQDTWEDATEFVGFTVNNPLEDAEWLQDANYSAIAMDKVQLEDYRKHVNILWSGQEDGTIRNLRIMTGYLDGDIRVQMTISFSGDKKNYQTGAAWAESVEFAMEECEVSDGNAGLLIIPKTKTNNYCSMDAYFVLNGALYHLHLVGKVGEEDAVSAVMNKILDIFS